MKGVLVKILVTAAGVALGDLVSDQVVPRLGLQDTPGRFDSYSLAEYGVVGTTVYFTQRIVGKMLR